MKNLVFILISVLFITSCDISDDSVPYTTVFVPIESVTMPTEFVLGQTYPMDLTYFKPSSCHSFYNFYYDTNGTTRTIAVLNLRYQEDNCVALDPEGNEVDVSFNFKVTQTGTYTFKFWQGTDENGNDSYYIVEVPVVEPEVPVIE